MIHTERRPSRLPFALGVVSLLAGLVLFGLINTSKRAAQPTETPAPEAAQANAAQLATATPTQAPTETPTATPNYPRQTAESGEAALAVLRLTIVSGEATQAAELTRSAAQVAYNAAQAALETSAVVQATQGAMEQAESIQRIEAANELTAAQAEAVRIQAWARAVSLVMFVGVGLAVALWVVVRGGEALARAWREADVPEQVEVAEYQPAATGIGVGDEGFDLSELNITPTMRELARRAARDGAFKSDHYRSMMHPGAMRDEQAKLREWFAVNGLVVNENRAWVLVGRGVQYARMIEEM